MSATTPEEATPLHLRVVWLPDDEVRDIYLLGDYLSFEPIPGATTIVDRGFALPGLVDAHCHIGIRRGAIPIENLDQARELARTDRDAGVLAIRDAGSPFPYPELEHESDLPRLIRAGQHIAASRRYLRGLGLECEPHEVVAAAAREAKAGSGWVKLVGDWIDRGRGDLAPSFEAEVLESAIKAAQAEGAKVAVHTFSAEAVRIVVEAGADSVEHGTGLSTDLLDEMARRGTALVPTMINIETFDDIAAQADEKFPTYADHMRDLKAGFAQVVGAAVDAGVDVYVGTDAGGGIDHGLAAEEMNLLHHKAGMSATDVLAAASWKARDWLGLPAHLGDVVVYADDPRLDLDVVRHPQRIILRGRIIL
ncbi:amidohydrolase family protein [Natronoglycomyces albus]|uniref:Amidohydrolase family protein n=1 Tax=Natronoglycomyces albus TaxID=2811108 RepID=A0A895XVE8_9ACTN|nr:amidohydrolase family protein [Natronoglycomyces albus]QSB06200.1 amidohydrolase family protein [Natronoglycomyces albus]